MKYSCLLALASVFLPGCATRAPNAEFVGSVNFSQLESFSFRQTLILGQDFHSSDQVLIEAVSKAVVSAEMAARGFELVDTESDFYGIVKWDKAVSSYPSHFDSIDGFHRSMERQDEPSYRFSMRLNLTVEIYESGNDKLFWKNDLPNIFDAIQLSEDRLVLSLERAMKYFPNRIEKDPNLPDLE